MKRRLFKQTDADYIGLHLRPSDSNELEDGFGVGCSKASGIIVVTTQSHYTETIVSDDGQTPIAVWGYRILSPHPEPTSINVWLIGTDELCKKTKEFYENSIDMLNSLRNSFPRATIWNHVIDNEDNLNYLRHLEFKITGDKKRIGDHDYFLFWKHLNEL